MRVCPSRSSLAVGRGGASTPPRNCLLSTVSASSCARICSSLRWCSFFSGARAISEVTRSPLCEPAD